MLTIKLGTELFNKQTKKYVLNCEKLLRISRKSDPTNRTQELILEVW
jgi:hypothetical protein